MQFEEYSAFLVSILWSQHNETQELPGKKRLHKEQCPVDASTAWIDNISTWTTLTVRDQSE